MKLSTLRLAREHPGPDLSCVAVYIDGVEQTAFDGLMCGMDPSSLLQGASPTDQQHRWSPGSSPHREPFSRCTCGVHGCCPTWVTISTDGTSVYWELEGHVRGPSTFRFAVDDYRQELDRFMVDHSGENLEERIIREVRESLGDRQLEQFGLRWRSTDWVDGTVYFYLDPVRDSSSFVELHFPISSTTTAGEIVEQMYGAVTTSSERGRR